MTLITTTVIDIMLSDDIDWPNANKLKVDEFNTLARPIIQKRFKNLDEDHVQKVSMRIWKIRRGEV